MFYMANICAEFSELCLTQTVKHYAVKFEIKFYGPRRIIHIILQNFVIAGHIVMGHPVYFIKGSSP